jgi:hypothetical protein
MTYELLTYESGEQVVVRTNADGSTSTIPLDPANSDYQRYLRWLENPDAEEGGTL